jgi:hypothetical protein
MGIRFQASEEREPQNTEQGIMNVEGKENFIIRNSLFDIRYSNQWKLIGVWSVVTCLCRLSSDLCTLAPDTFYMKTNAIVLRAN